MKSFRDRLKTLLDGFSRRTGQAKQVNEEIQDLALEIRELARVAGRINDNPKDLQEKIDRIMAEMDQLHRLTTKREFRRLSPENRMRLRQSLIQSRQQLIDSVRSAPTPTDLVQ